MRPLRRMPTLLLLTVLSWAASAGAPSAGAQTVRAILFFSPTCPHCEKVIQQDLPVLFRTFGGEPSAWVDPLAAPSKRYFYLLGNEELEILLIDVTQPPARDLFLASFPPDLDKAVPRGVPRLIVGDAALEGDIEIPARFPTLVEQGLKNGGVDWPGIPGLATVVARIPKSALKARAGASTPEEPVTIPARRATMSENFRRDPVGNGTSVLVLVGMIVGLLALPKLAGRAREDATLGAAIAVLTIVGMGVAAYLTYVEAAHVSAVCGPVGDCNTVQQSPYATLFGVVPVGALGLVGYGWILAAWLLSRVTTGVWSQRAKMSVFVMATVGTLFSAYLTFLEPFVIGATCAWCLTSAVVITLLTMLSAGPALQARATRT